MVADGCMPYRSQIADVPISVVGAEHDHRQELVNALREAGCAHVHAVSGREPLPPSTIAIVCGGARLETIVALRSDQRCASLQVLAACRMDEDGGAFLSAGANALLWLGAPPAVTANQVALTLERAADKHALREVVRFQDTLLKIRALVAERGDGADVLRDILLMAAGILGFERASMMAHVESSAVAYVLAATDDPALQQFELAIEDYPEVHEAIRLDTALLIGDVRTHPVTAPFSEVLVSRHVLSIAVFPVSWKGRSMGALLFRKSSPGVQHLSHHAEAFASLMASQFAAQLRDSSLFDRLRDQTRRFTRAGYEAERRARAIESLNEYFEASGEGIFVVDQQRKLIYVNGAAEAITGFAKDALLGTDICQLLPELQDSAIQEVMEAVFEGNNIEPVDIDLKCTTGKYVTVSLSSSTLLSKHGAVIMSFRDVTRQRSLEAQLHHSNEFLSNLIDSAVDAIIAVDMRGVVIVFNKGAERLFGLSASEVVGRMSVAKLYPAGVARQVMRMLRSQNYGGVGRLEQIRREVKIRSGESVPVNMTASTIYDDGKEVATVGIFSDLRDRIRIEQRLLQAQEKIKEQEQRSMLAGLAGAAAHELNQPLTSIIGYAQLIQRTLELDERHLRYTATIVEEAERMAEIVKKIGRITHYETVSYVGSANIVDIDRSVEASESAPVPAIIYDDEEATARISLDQIAESHEQEMSARGQDSAARLVPKSEDE